MDRLQTLTVPGTNDTVYLYFLTHGDSYVQSEFHNVTCGWDNPSLVALGAVSFKGVQTWPAERHPAVSVKTGSGTQPLIDIRSAPSHMTLAFMMCDTRVAANLTGQTQTLRWSISRGTLNGAVTTAPGVAGSIRHQFTLDTPLSWVVIGIDLPNQPSNIEQRWLGQIRPTGDKLPGGTTSLTLRNFRVGTGTNEYMVVGITSPGPLDNLKVTWDATCSNCSQDMSEIDAYAIPDDSVDYCSDLTVPDPPPGSALSWCRNFGTSTQPYLYWYGLKLPHPGNKLLTVSWTNDLSASSEPLVNAMALSFANVDQLAPYKNINHANGALDGSAGPVSLDIMSTSSNDMTVALLGNGGGKIWCNPTQTSNVPSVGHGIDIASSRAPGASGGGIVTHSWMHGEDSVDNKSSCSRVIATTYPVLYGISGFDIVQAPTAPPPEP